MYDDYDCYGLTTSAFGANPLTRAASFSVFPTTRPVPIPSRREVVLRETREAPARLGAEGQPIIRKTIRTYYPHILGDYRKYPPYKKGIYAGWPAYFKVE